MKRLLLTICLTFFACRVGLAETTDEAKWRWIWVQPDYRKEWTTYQGDANLAISGSKFDVTLSVTSGPVQPSIHLVGTLSQGKAAATGTLYATDSATEKFSGEVWRALPDVFPPGNGRDSDLIVLRSGPTFIGLYRQVTQSTPAR